MAQDHSSIRKFVLWASSDQGREELLSAIANTSGYPRRKDSVADAILDDHLAVIKNFGLVVGAVRIKILVKIASSSLCPTAPVVSIEELDALEALFDPATHR